MGYLLPIQPIQSQLYANRMNRERYNFAYINRVNSVRLNPDNSRDFEDSLQDEMEMEAGESKSSVEVLPASFQGYISPNPANLSPIIAQVVGKGQSINAYV
ncbi:hypothetical protein FITA111629_03365 [Filibacter tadaridae]|uniref:Uncharacterized protein n=1 Tax=Filibacter tadaridae TaxID=2483811 RepID=A0A3P5XFZ5_9BACL|nr:hypothetical protein [Filibacter tadaridae]VDC27476.1 hypothetical protein FILTAD_01591 [Filibacter tadaridae]